MNTINYELLIFMCTVPIYDIWDVDNKYLT